MIASRLSRAVVAPRLMRSLATIAPIAEGATVPDVTFKTRVAVPGADSCETSFTWKDVTSKDLFAGKRVVLFGLPGAYTPTCSSTHVPEYNKLYDDIRAAGVDDVICVSVNDAFVMRNWGISLGLEPEDNDATSPLNPGNFKKVKMLPDGAALFTRGMGMSCLWDTNRGFGERSWRYSAVINDSKVEKIFIEGGAVSQNSGPDPFEVSDANTMLKYLKSTQK